MNPTSISSNKVVTPQPVKYEGPTGFVSSLLHSFEVPTLAENIDLGEVVKGMAPLFLPGGILRTAFQAYTAFSLLSAASAAEPQNAEPQKETIEVTNCEDLNRIGDPIGGLPKNGKYVLKNDIDCKGQIRFTSTAKIDGGELDGNGYSISNLGNCLFQEIKDGSVHDLTIKDSLLGSAQPCFLSGSVTGESNIHDVTFKNVEIKNANLWDVANSAGSAGLLSRTIVGNTQVSNITIENSNLRVLDAPTSTKVGLLAGIAQGGITISNIKIKDSVASMPLTDYTHNAYCNVGGCVGLMSGNTKLDQLVNKNVTVLLKSYQGSVGSVAAVVSGSASVTNVLVYKSSISSQSFDTHTGAVLGLVGSTGSQSNLNSYKNKVVSSNSGARAAGVIGKINGGVDNKVTDLFSVENTVSANAAGWCSAASLIGQADSRVVDGFAVNNTVIKKGQPQRNAIDIVIAKGSTVSTVHDCSNEKFKSSFFDAQCKLKINDNVPATSSSTPAQAPTASEVVDVLPKWGAGALAGIATGLAVTLAVGGVVYFIRKYVCAEKAEETGEGRSKVAFVPVTEL